ncbi:MAG: flagellar assembly protein FliW [bacterium]|nr:flagellar assembly protein FliW [bacterium]
MLVKTLLFGDIEVNDEFKIVFISPILGFEDEREFILIKEKEDSPFCWLQSLRTPELAFLLADPFIFFPEYVVELEDTYRDKDIVIYVIVTLNEDFKLSTANLVAPIIIDAENKEASQIILENSPYTTRHCIFENIAQSVTAG